MADKWEVKACGESKRSTDIDKAVDLYRDTPVRYLGYANEVGEAFRSLVHVNLVRFSYVVASSYVIADAYNKGNIASEKKWKDPSTKRTKVTHAVLDTLVWQGLASVAIPGFTINRICFVSNWILQRSLQKMPTPVRKWTVTGIGLAAIPFIIKPIDRTVDYLMNNSMRKWYHMDSEEEQLVHHERND
ncbi:mitochondrial fission process protein 1 [Lingula anatina]|uniref:Mitochondrial fission process protein 1 n=1 Tax=Lingula anatina TaxID=7574 RepID=A0A1S3H136_LINAN|nr:mitochondrial fission process protein 1 [Lingula anatina]|eukprot:XP_013379647.1 mitochondrial fission process protein 1 [Lingula anatina]